MLRSRKRAFGRAKACQSVELSSSLSFSSFWKENRKTEATNGNRGVDCVKGSEGEGEKAKEEEKERKRSPKGAGGRSGGGGGEVCAPVRRGPPCKA